MDNMHSNDLLKNLSSDEPYKPYINKRKKEYIENEKKAKLAMLDNQNQVSYSSTQPNQTFDSIHNDKDKSIPFQNSIENNNWYNPSSPSSQSPKETINWFDGPLSNELMPRQNIHSNSTQLNETNNKTTNNNYKKNNSFYRNNKNHKDLNSDEISDFNKLKYKD
ncbi:hypothetical protein DICPUDRAFT_151135 [Dictyostelium purpureum]|uniref:Uncharacterized protein n=1 Tax=Dictyostelium purpureum TaxID=5786 RepID=F0ZI30_DICPU|nr:uncharacterized protein DICPUDRAFT_151135 [Dictyostelium purpureum]EGC36375.1 hypothetical protein DICPUDRAFT_151135 [Dictyostelium purpureum]|eukprot:XP_003287072.1 hypothetical protein DICPUDRAFT_151135 [Dictyostelium purpureum]